MKRVRIAMTLLAIFLIAGSALSQRLIWLGRLSQGDPASVALDVSANGPVVVGYSGLIDIDSRAFRWTPTDGMQELPTLGGANSQALAVSADGSVIVGWAEDANGKRHAVRWLADGTVQPLITFDFTRAEARGVSADGSVIVGWVTIEFGETRVFRWTESEGATLLDLGSGSDWGYAYGCSSDGSKIVGKAEFEIAEHPFLWTPDSLFVLTNLKGEALAVSDTGNVVVGWIETEEGDLHAFYWTPAEGLQDLSPDVRGPFSFARAYDVSANGRVIVGEYDGKAFRRTPQNGIEFLDDAYADLLPDNPFITYLGTANAISPNGRYIVGAGMNPENNTPEAFLLDTQGATAVEETAPVAAGLVSLWPNPFREAIHIHFLTATPSNAQVSICDLLGRSLRTLLDQSLPAGTHEILWDGRDNTGRQLPAGVYLLRLTVGGKVHTQVVTIIR